MARIGYTNREQPTLELLWEKKNKQTTLGVLCVISSTSMIPICELGFSAKHKRRDNCVGPATCLPPFALWPCVVPVCT